MIRRTLIHTALAALLVAAAAFAWQTFAMGETPAVQVAGHHHAGNHYD